MNKLTAPVLRSIRTGLSRLVARFPEWSSWDSQEWSDGVHRRQI